MLLPPQVSKEKSVLAIVYSCPIHQPCLGPFSLPVPMHNPNHSTQHLEQHRQTCTEVSVLAVACLLCYKQLQWCRQNFQLKTQPQNQASTGESLRKIFQIFRFISARYY